jgi:biotin-(acetyl-CoA carboxylase) ligase
MEDFGVDKYASLQMKFVNDVFLNEKKVCGILSRMETAPGCDHFKLMIGEHITEADVRKVCVGDFGFNPFRYNKFHAV